MLYSTTRFINVYTTWMTIESVLALVKHYNLFCNVRPQQASSLLGVWVAPGSYSALHSVYLIDGIICNRLEFFNERFHGNLEF